MKQLIHVFFICLLCTSCSLSGSKTQLQILGKDPISLTGVPVYSDSILWGSHLIDFMDGNYIKSYFLDTPVDYFVVSQDDSFLLGSTCDLETGDDYVRKFYLNR